MPLQAAREEQSSLPLSNGTQLTAPQPSRRPVIARQSAGHAESALSATPPGEGEARFRSTADQIWVVGKPGIAGRSVEVCSTHDPNQDLTDSSPLISAVFRSIGHLLYPAGLVQAQQALPRGVHKSHLETRKRTPLLQLEGKHCLLSLTAASSGEAAPPLPANTDLRRLATPDPGKTTSHLQIRGLGGPGLPAFQLTRPRPLPAAHRPKPSRCQQQLVKQRNRTCCQGRNPRTPATSKAAVAPRSSRTRLLTPGQLPGRAARGGHQPRSRVRTLPPGTALPFRAEAQPTHQGSWNGRQLLPAASRVQVPEPASALLRRHPHPPGGPQVSLPHTLLLSPKLELTRRKAAGRQLRQAGPQW